MTWSKPRTRGALIATGLLLAMAVPGVALAAMPLPDGAYCGPGDARIGIDGRANVVTIAGYSCGWPIFAAEKLQSIQCRRGDGPAERREFDVRVFDHALMYNGQWFRPCQP